MSGLACFAREGIEAGKAGLKEEADTVGRAVSLLGDIEFAREAADIGGHGLRFAILGGAAVIGLIGSRFLAEEHDEIGILLDRTGFTQMVKGGFGIGFLRFTIELGKHDDRNLEFHRESFEAAGDFRHFDLAIFFSAAGTGGEKLKIVDNQNIDSVLFFDSASAGTKLSDGQKAGLIQKEGKIGDLRCDTPEGGDLAFVEVTAANLL